MEEDYFKNEPRQDTPFYVMLGALLVITILSVGIDVTQYSQHSDLQIPSWYFYIIFGIDLLIILGLYGILKFRKWGVYLYPAAVLFHFMAHEYYLSTFLYSDVTNLFVYVSLGLFVFIPKWKYFN